MNTFTLVYNIKEIQLSYIKYGDDYNSYFDDIVSETLYDIDTVSDYLIELFEKLHGTYNIEIFLNVDSYEYISFVVTREDYNYIINSISPFELMKELLLQYCVV